jgi:predicted RNA methylase
MKFKATPYHSDLLSDGERLSAFFNAINEYDSGTGLAYDLGCGSGILSYFLSPFFDEIISLEKNAKAADCAKENLKDFANVHIVNEDVLDYEFTKRADLIVCEMMDTALIDEEQIPVLNHAREFLKSDGVIIPMGIINTAELVNMERNNIHWDEDGAVYEVLSDAEVYSSFDFSDYIEPSFEMEISLKANRDGVVNGLKITTYTKLNESLICGPTPMLNPSLLIPLEEKSAKGNDFIKVKLKYIMGDGIESIETQYL